MLQGVSPEGNGVLLRLHFRDSLVSGAYRAVAPADTSVPSAVVAVRYLLRDTPHTFYFDSGAVQVRRAGGKISGGADGSASESGMRMPTRIRYRDVALPEPADTVPCRFEW